MAKKGSADLFRLIKELTPHEKAYFKKYARQHSAQGTEYLKLFEEMDGAEEHDDKAFSKKFKNYAYLKNYLFNLLLNTLVNYNNNPHNTQLYLMNSFMNAVILEQKGFTQHAVKELKQGKVMAAKNNFPLLEYMFARSYYRIQGTLLDVNKKQQYLQTSYNALNTIIQSEISQLNYRYEYDKLILLSTQYTQGAADPIPEADINFSLLAEPPQHANVAEKRSYHEVLLAYYFSKRDFAKAYLAAHEYLKQEKKLLREANNDLYNYSQALAFCMVTATELGKNDEAEKLIEALGKIRSPNKRINGVNLARYMAYKLILLGITNRYAEGAAFAIKARQDHPQLYKHETNVTHYQPLICYSLYALFANKNYKECINLLNDVNIVSVRKNAIYSYKDLEILRLMLQAEMGNYQLIGNLTRAVSAKLKRYNLEDEYIRELLKFFNGMPGSINESNKRALVNKLSSIVTANPEKQMSYFFLGIFYYQDWVKGLKVVNAENV